MERIILHCDLNNFFASAALTVNPTLRNMPLAVCGDTEKRHGIVLAKNYLAKDYGIKTAETVWEAKRKCPELVTVAPDFKLYENLSLKARSVYGQYSDKVECFGIDECWVDISDPKVDMDKAFLIADDIRRRIKRELRLTISIGVSFNKYFAKLGSDMKKPDAITVISRENFKDKVWPLPCSDLLMVGRQTTKFLNSIGVFTIGDLAATPDKVLQKKLGINGIRLKQAALGNDKSEVVDFTTRALPKSIGRSATAECDLKTNREVFAALLEFSENVAFQLRQYGLLAKSVCISVVDADFEGREMRVPLNSPSNNSAVLAKAGYDLFIKEYNWEKPVRAVGIRAINLINENDCVKQLNLFDDCLETDILEKIENSIMLIRGKYGKDSVMRAVCMKNAAKPSTPGFYKR